MALFTKTASHLLIENGELQRPRGDKQMYSQPQGQSVEGLPGGLNVNGWCTSWRTALPSMRAGVY
jgi:hypothetical protein